MNKKILILLGILTCYVVSYAQTTVKGKVTDGNNVGIPGVSVLIKGSTTGASTSGDGTYSIVIPSNNATLVFKSIGFVTREVLVGGRTQVDIILSNDENKLDEVMVVAYGTAKRGSYTGSAAVIDQDKIKDAPSTSFQNALTGRAAGVQVTASSGQAGSTPSIRIRGIGSINASNDPLYVVDGVPVVSGNIGQGSDYTQATNNIMNTINPADIESITILKDAAASSLYGSRAANGVVLINTKRGKLGKPKIEFRTSLGLTPTWATDNYETANVQDQVNMLYRIFHDVRTSAGQSETAGNTYALSQLNNKFNKHGYRFTTDGTGLNANVNILGMTDGIENREGKYFDWDDALFRMAKYQTNDLAVSGGDEKTKYYSSFSYTRDQSRIKVNDFDRYSGRINLSQKVGRYVEIGSNVSITRSAQSGYNDTRNTGANSYFQTRNLLWPLYWPTDYKTGLPFTARYGSLAQNNIYYDNQWDNKSVTKRFVANPYIQVNILPELILKSVFSYDNSQVGDHIYYSALHFNGLTNNGSVNEITTNYNKMVSSSTVNYSKQFGLHSISLLAGFEAEKNVIDFQRATGVDLGSSELQSVSTAGTTSSSAYNWGNSIVSGLSRLEYNFNQKYFITTSLRRDGSSRLGDINRWGTFWSVGASWKINSEDFLKEVSFLDNLRLRGSYGTNGTLPSNNYDWRELTSFSNKYLGQPAALYASLSNPLLTWENSYSTNIALEFGLFKRIRGTIEFFNRDTKNLLLGVPVSMTTGFSSTLRNIGEINNRGIEFDLNANLMNKNGFKWDLGINGSFTRSKVTKLYKPEGTARGNDIIWNDPTGGDARAQFLYSEGLSMLSFYGFEWAGVNPANGKNVWYLNGNTPATGSFDFNGRPATYNYNDANRVVIGDGNPDVFGGINTDVEYKGFSLGLNFIYKLGGQIYDGAYKDVADDGYYWERIRAQSYYDNMWTPQNTSGTQPKLDGNDLTDAMQYSSRQLHSASFLRLKNVLFAYRFPEKITSKLGASNIRAYFNGSNLLTFSKYKEADPEVGNYGTRGWETPFGKTYTFGLEVSF
ncbi:MULTISPECIES: SusC/RagA family TonB-linked outer membrane protein [unclassified Pedobacter]|uniref:SusC/RagA family TonB-linked outer membrane protein n=1 Tax=unclassified Pedobacter TaxID=2628915 RepID=UPI001422B538|nr:MULTISPECIES: TonB-dependent receptor [unclassified Pedobacter]NII82439.1 TonB-linked SusC/RagA family outer membrane protein [Pedobacter sp. SG908]NMN36464.1 TonB-linked SusC/RagA family outer membrane protein [Pedobacter sp. SG918]